MVVGIGESRLGLKEWILGATPYQAWTFYALTKGRLDNDAGYRA
jgi:hypothetical protein